MKGGSEKSSHHWFWKA